VASRFDNRGALVLSEFTGAAWELNDALQVNPFDIESLAEAMRQAVEMPESGAGAAHAANARGGRREQRLPVGRQDHFRALEIRDC